jgi:hypothetical protein
VQAAPNAVPTEGQKREKPRKPEADQSTATYPLLDYDNTYGLESVALYLARQGLLIRWPLDECARLMAGEPISLTEARRDLQKALA